MVIVSFGIRRARARTIAAIVSCAAFTSVACGGSDSTSPAGPPASVASAASGGSVSTSAIPGTSASLQPSVKVTDAAGNGVSGVHVTVSVTGGGTVQNPNPVTNASGVASVGAWKLGPKYGRQNVTISVSGLPSVVFTAFGVGTFSVDIRFIGGTPSDDIKNAITRAGLRVGSIVTTALAEFNAVNFNTATYCHETGLPTLTEKIPNVIVFAEIAPIDGAGKILGSTGPCALRTSSSLPVIALMKFDSADLSGMVADGTIDDVMFHELQHALGYGLLWTGPPYFATTLLQNAGTSNPIYLGAAARTEYVAAGGTSAAGVPVEGGNLDGTSNSHWRKSTFQSELMTGYLSGTIHPFSKISIAALADLGYSVSYDAADAYTVPAPGNLRTPGPQIDLSGETLIYPTVRVDNAGHVTPIGATTQIRR